MLSHSIRQKLGCLLDSPRPLISPDHGGPPGAEKGARGSKKGRVSEATWRGGGGGQSLNPTLGAPPGPWGKNRGRPHLSRMRRRAGRRLPSTTWRRKVGVNGTICSANAARARAKKSRGVATEPRLPTRLRAPPPPNPPPPPTPEIKQQHSGPGGIALQVPQRRGPTTPVSRPDGPRPQQRPPRQPRPRPGPPAAPRSRRCRKLRPQKKAISLRSRARIDQERASAPESG